jgi:hypothetical protein
MKTLLVFILWCLLFAVCWPLAILALVLFPFVWLVALPFRLAFAAAEGFVALIRGILFLPARLVGWRPRC